MTRRGERVVPSLRSCGFLAVVAMVGIPSVARADHTADKGIAEALFRDAKQRLEAGDVDGACPKFQDSQKIDPALGTLLYLAICHERQNRTASAWSEFASASSWADRSDQSDRGDLARKHMAALEARLWKLTIHAPPTAVAGLELRVDSGVMSLASVDTPLPLDPGDHAIEASAPDHKPWSITVRVPNEAGGATIQIPPLELLPVAPPPVVATTAPLPVLPPAPPPESGSGRAIATWSGGILAVAGVAMGTVFGVLTFQERSNARSLCSNGVCKPGGTDDIHQAYTDSTVSTVGFAVGAAGAVVATYFLFQGKPSTSTGAAARPSPVMIAPALSPRDVGFVVQARFE
jgi:hypothetical protein